LKLFQTLAVAATSDKIAPIHILNGMATPFIQTDARTRQL
jgi:hypothetical protein